MKSRDNDRAMLRDFFADCKKFDPQCAEVFEEIEDSLADRLRRKHRPRQRNNREK